MLGTVRAQYQRKKVAMHLSALFLLMLVLPTACVLAEKLVLHSAAGWMPLVGRW
jgi:hypothetical protein